MSKPEDVLISVEGRHLAKMLNGEKTIELRRRRLKIAPGTRVWIYSKLPSGRVEAIGIVQEVIVHSPAQLWARFKDKFGISFQEFNDYLSGVQHACAIIFSSIFRLRNCVALAELRRVTAQFQPPQFYKRLQLHSPEFALLSTKAP